MALLVDVPPEAGSLLSFECGYKPLDIVRLSDELSRLEIPHRLSERVLEIKLYLRRSARRTTVSGRANRRGEGTATGRPRA